MTENNHFIGEVGQKAFIVRDGKVLMVNAVGEPGWDFPGGRLNVNEEPHDGLRRELQEELGIADVTIGQALHIIPATVKSGDSKLMIVYACVLPVGTEFVLKEDEIAAVRWVGKEDVADLETHPSWLKVLRTHFSIID